MASPSLCLDFWGEDVHPLLPPQGLLVLFAQETPDPWQSLDPFDSLDAKPFKKGNWVEGHLHSGTCGWVLRSTSGR